MTERTMSMFVSKDDFIQELSGEVIFLSDALRAERAETAKLSDLLAEYMRLATSQAVADEDWSGIIEETARALGVPVPA